MLLSIAAKALCDAYLNMPRNNESACCMATIAIISSPQDSHVILDVFTPKSADLLSSEMLAVGI